MICHDLLDAPWLITEPAFHELHNRARDPEFVRAAISFLDQFALTNNDRPLPYDLYGSVAVISCTGIFSKRSSWWSWYSGYFTADRVQFAISHALSNPIVKSIVLDIDSPGGTVAGCMELAQYIFDARGHGKKIIAVANELCASAALWIGTAADELVTTAAGRVGSLGVLNGRYDYTGMNERIGLKVYLFSSGECKTFSNPDTPMTEAEKAYQQEVVAVYAQQFIDGVARNRGVSSDEARSQWASARVWIGQAAVDVGLADRIATLDSVVAELSGQPGVTVSETEGIQMAKAAQTPELTLGTPAAGATPPEQPAPQAGAAAPAASSGGVLIEETPLNLTASQVQKGSPDATAQLQASGADAENQRVQALIAEFSGDSAFLQAAVADKTMTVEKAKAKKYDETKGTLKALTEENTKLKTEGVVGFAAGDKPAPGAAADVSNPEALEKEAVALWNADEKLRAEFSGMYTAYLAGFKAEPDLYRKKK